MLINVLLPAVHRKYWGWEDGAHTEVGRQGDQSGQGSQWKRPHTSKCLHTKYHRSSICVCACADFAHLSSSLHHRHSRSDRSFAHVAMRRHSKTQHWAPLPHPHHCIVPLHHLKPWTTNALTPATNPGHVDGLCGCCSFPTLFIHTVSSVLTLLLTVTSVPMFFTLYCCSFYWKKHWINSNDLLLLFSL